MASLEICTHSWNYSRLLTLQLSQLVLHPPKETEVTVTVCRCDEDYRTREVVEFFQAKDIPNVEIRSHVMEHDFLMRRGIGRNEVAKATEADAIMFVDADYLHTGPCIDAIAKHITESRRNRIWYPHYVAQSIDHIAGDFEILRVEEVAVYDITPDRYVPKRIPRPIGGCQWIKGDVARAKGYLPDGSKWLRPEDCWKQTREDCCARRHWKLQWEAIEGLEGIYRTRHSIRGRTQIGCRL